jgi:hypothetical protein
MATRRRNAFTKAGVPNLREVLDALVTVFSPLKLGVYGFVFTDHGLRIGKGKFNFAKCKVLSGGSIYYYSHCTLFENRRQERKTRRSH